MSLSMEWEANVAPTRTRHNRPVANGSRRGLRLREFGFGLLELLVQLRRLDFRQQLAGVHVLTDIHVPFP